jgi:triosephosphate isomerase
VTAEQAATPAGGDGPAGQRLVGVSLKMYLGLEQTYGWLSRVADLARTGLPTGVELFVAPDFVALTRARDLLSGTPVRLGAQDAFWEQTGAYTGEVSPATLRDAGCSYVEVGHAERRRLFGEDDGVVARKAGAVADAGLTPVVCVGEQDHDAVDDAVQDSRRQLEPVLVAVSPDADLVVAYEPVWAIGAQRPAGADRVVEVITRLRETVTKRPGRTRLIYGGSAGPGLFAELAPALDGLFIGRAAHDVDALAEALADVGAAAPNPDTTDPDGEPSHA